MDDNIIEVYSWATPNGHKVHIMLEECGLPYRAIPVDIGAGDQFKPEFLALSPNNKIPAIVDPVGPDAKPISMFESGAILLYLAGKTGKFLPAETRATSAASAKSAAGRVRCECAARGRARKRVAAAPIRAARAGHRTRRR